MCQMANLQQRKIYVFTIQLWTTQKPAYLIKFNPSILYWIDFSLLFLLVTLLNFYEVLGRDGGISFERRATTQLNNNTVENIYGGSSYHKGTIVLSKLSSSSCSFRSSLLILCLRSTDHSAEKCLKKVSQASRSSEVMEAIRGPRGNWTKMLIVRWDLFV